MFCLTSHLTSPHRSNRYENAIAVNEQLREKGCPTRTIIITKPTEFRSFIDLIQRLTPHAITDIVSKALSPETLAPNKLRPLHIQAPSFERVHMPIGTAPHVKMHNCSVAGKFGGALSDAFCPHSPNFTLKMAHFVGLVLSDRFVYYMLQK